MDLINTLNDKRSGYTCRSYLKVQLKHKIQCVIGRPCTKDYK